MIYLDDIYDEIYAKAQRTGTGAQQTVLSLTHTIHRLLTSFYIHLGGINVRFSFEFSESAFL